MYITNIFSKDTYQISIFDWYYNIDKCRIGSIITYLMLCIAAMPLHIYKFSIGLNFKVSIIHLWSHGLGQVAPRRLVSKLMIVLLWVFESWLECMKTCQKKNLSIFYFFLQCIWLWPYPCSSCQQGTQSTGGFHKNGSKTSGCAMLVWWLSSWDLVLPWLRLGPANLEISLWLQEPLEWLWCPTSFL